MATRGAAHLFLLQLSDARVQAPLLISRGSRHALGGGEDTELGVAAQLSDIHAGRGGDGAATEEAQRGMSAQEAELGVVD